MAHRYRAVMNGTLYNPYRFIRKGEVVVLDQPLPSPSAWLKPEDEGETILKNKLPVTPYVTEDGRAAHALAGARVQAKELVPPAPVNPAYQAQIEALQKGESIRDKEAIPTITLPTKDDKAQDEVHNETTGGDAPASTGDQDVLA